MLKLLIQGGNKKSGMRYSLLEGQKELLDLLVAKLPHYVYEVTDRVVWWRMISPEGEAMFLADVDKIMSGGNFEIQEGGSHNPHVGSSVDEALEEMDNDKPAVWPAWAPKENYESKAKEIVDNLPGFDKQAILTNLAGEFYKPEKLEWLGDNGLSALIYFPVLQTTRNKEKIYFFSKVVKVELATMEEKVVFDGSSGERLGRNKRQDLIKREL